jgi:hypothetical protein
MKLGIGLGLDRDVRVKRVNGTAFTLDLAYVPPSEGSPFQLDLAYVPSNGTPFSLSLAYEPPNGTSALLTFDPTGYDGVVTTITISLNGSTDTWTYGPLSNQITYVGSTGTMFTGTNNQELNTTVAGSGVTYGTDNASNIDGQISFTDGTDNTGWDSNATNVTVTGPAGTDLYSFSEGAFTFVGGTGMSTTSGNTITGNGQGAGYSYSTDGASNADGWITLTDGTPGTGWDEHNTNVTVSGPVGSDIYLFSNGSFTFVSGIGLGTVSGPTITGNYAGSGYSYSTDNASNADGWITFNDGAANTGWDEINTYVTITMRGGEGDVYLFDGGTFTFQSGPHFSSASSATITGNTVGSGYSYSTDDASNADGWITFTDGTG